MTVEFPTDPSECNTYGYTYDSNCTGADGLTLDYDQTWHSVVLNGVTAWVPLSGESSTGVDGADGAQGPQGATGEAGTVGRQGNQGVTGEDGAPGGEGTKGDEGPAGPTGADASAPGLTYNDINVLETMFVDTIGPGANDFSVSSTDAFTYDPSNLGALRINRIRENIQTVTQNSSGQLDIKGICGPCLFTTTASDGSNANKLSQIRLNNDVVDGTFKNWMVGDFVTLIVRQTNNGFNTNQFGHRDGETTLRKTTPNEAWGTNEIKYGGGNGGVFSFGNAQDNVDILYINCINEVGGAIKPYFLVNHLQFHDGATSA